jgi:hypothetical protein
MFAAARKGRITLRAAAVAVLGALMLASPAAASTDAQLQFDPVDQTWAETILLSETDLGPNWRSLPVNFNGDPRENSICAGGPDESDLTITGGNAADFVRADGGAIIASTVTIWQTSEQAQADWDRSVQPALLNCVAAGLRSASTKKIKLVVTAKRALAYPVIAPRTAAYRFAISYRTTVRRNKKRRVVATPATFDLILLGNGRASAALATLSFNKVPLAESSKQSFASMLAKRMAADPTAAAG